jgi:hypothetical protein
MNRRSALRALTIASLLPAGCLADPPGPTGPRNPPDEPANDPRETPDPQRLRITDFDVEATEDGRLQVVGTIENRGGAERLATVRAEVTTDERRVRTTAVEVPPESTVEFAIVFDVTHERFTERGDLNLELV